MNLQVIVPILLAIAPETPASGPVFPPPVSREEIPALLESTAFVRGLDEAALVALVPEQSGLRYVGCPNCPQQRMEEHLDWSPERPDEVACRFCRHRYPSETYPMDRVLTVKNARGEVQRYPYWENPQGYRYFFRARRDGQVREYLAEKARELAILYALTGEKAHARRAALLLDRFAQVFPGWCYHYDYPFRQKEVYEANHLPPPGAHPPYRVARWTSWAYRDIPDPLVRAYDWIRGAEVFEELSRHAGVDVASRIEHDLFRNAAEQVLAIPEGYTNMSPATWRMLVTVGRVIGEPRYVHEVVRRVRRFVDTRFFYDGSWPEGSPDYASQSVEWLAGVLDVLRGYSDPPGYTDGDGTRFEVLDLADDLPRLRQIRASLAKMRLPDGRPVPIHDTWHSSRRGPLAATEPYLLPALGHACLGGGSGEAQAQFHLTWSGAYGHEHADNLSLLLHARGREMLSDLGYTHTRDRAWTLATAGHNTVVIDGESQAFGGRNKPPTDGSLRYFDASDPRVQVVGAEGTRGYPGRAKVYARTLIVVQAGGGRWYAVDVFEVEGGRTHDYFLHGDADAPTSVATEREGTPLATLLPAGLDWKPARHEGDRNLAYEPHYAYGYLRNLKEVSAPANVALPATFRPSDSRGPRLRVTFFPQEGSRLILGENPSVRLAGEDDAQLDNFKRPFAMLRHSAADGRSVFVATIEPYAEAPFLTAIERIETGGATIALRVEVGDRTDFVVFRAKNPVRLERAGHLTTFSGDVGVLSLRGGAVEHAYVLGAGGWERGDFSLRSGGSPGAPLRAVDGDSLVLDGTGGDLPKTGDVARLITDDGWVYPYTVVGVERRGDAIRLRVAEEPGLTFDATSRKLRLSAYPQREHRGAVRVDWTAHAAR